MGTPTLTIKNVSKEYISVCAEKDWGNTAQDRQLPVVVELCRNNTPLNSENGFNRQTLSADNNWTCEWIDLLLFIDGKAAECSLREVKIGNTAYDGSADSEVGKFRNRHRFPT